MKNSQNANPVLRRPRRWTRALCVAVAAGTVTSMIAVAGVGGASADDSSSSGTGSSGLTTTTFCPSDTDGLIAMANATAGSAADFSRRETGDPHSLYSAVRSYAGMHADAYYSKGFFGQDKLGNPIDVALIDTGVDPVAGLDNGNVVHGPDLSFEAPTNEAHTDTYGHGTHLAGIIAGRDDTNPSATAAHSSFGWNDPTNFTGVAPGARVVSVKTADSDGAVDVTQIIAAIDWVVKHRKSDGLNVRVLNLSFGLNSSPYDNQTSDALSYAVEQAWKNGIVVVAADGNGGFGRSSNDPGLTSPAFNRDILAVGSYDPAQLISNPSGAVPDFSSSSAAGNSRNPDVLAPGASVLSLHAPGTMSDEEIVGACTGSGWTSPVQGTDGRFVRASGTSQSAAMVAGAAALVLSKNPEFTPDQVKALLRRSADPLPAVSQSLQGQGTIDLAKAFGMVPGPTQTGSYINGGASLDAARGMDFLFDQNAPTIPYELRKGACGTVNPQPMYCLQLPDPAATLSGNVDIFGNAIDLSALQKAEGSAAAWTKNADGKTESWVTNGFVLGTSFQPDSTLGLVWPSDFNAVARYTTVDSSRWNLGWTGRSWSGRRWSDFDWSGHSWSGRRWSGRRWSGRRWSGRRWSDHAWKDNAWS